MATIAECPHCYTRVGLSKEGKCPACGKNVNDRAGINPDLARLEIRVSDKLPDSCFCCDLPTKRRVKIQQSVARAQQEELHLPPLVPLAIRVLHALTGLFSDWTENRITVRVKLPQCERCARGQKPEPENVDFDRAQFSFIVHKGFKDKVRQLNR